MHGHARAIPIAPLNEPISPLVRHKGGGTLENSYNCVAGMVVVNGFGPFAIEKVVAEGVNDCVTRFALIYSVRGKEWEVKLASEDEAINVIAETVVEVVMGQGI
jgi:hypothetical protein